MPMKLRADKHAIADLAPIFLGAILGFSIYLLNEIFDNIDDTLHAALLAFFWVGPIMAMFISEPRSLIRDIALASLVAALLSVLTYVYMNDVGDINNGGILFLMLFIVGAGTTTFIQSARIDRRRLPPLPSWQRYAWDNILTIILSTLFVGAGWLVLFLWAALFKLINIDFFEDLFTDTDWFLHLFWGTMFGSGVWLARGRPQIVQAVGRLFGVLFRTLTPVLALVSIMFLVTLPFVGLQPLWDTKSATAILLSLVFAIALGTSGAALVREQGGKVSAFENWVMRAGLLALPVLTCLAAYAVWLRIDQYGLTPERIYVAAVLIFAAIVAVTGAFAAILVGRDWLVTIDRFLPLIAVVTMALSALLHLPLFEPFGMTVKNQVARFDKGLVEPSDFDFGLLKFNLGEKGRTALTELRQDSRFAENPKVQEIFAQLDDADNYWEWSGGRDLTLGPGVDLSDLTTYMRIHPDNHEIPDGLVEAITSNPFNPRTSCATSFSSDTSNCHLFFQDLNEDGIVDVFLWMYGWELWPYLQSADGQWRAVPRLMVDNEGFDYDELVAAMESGDVTLAEPSTKAVVVGGIRFE